MWKDKHKQKEYYIKNKEKVAAQLNLWRLTNPDKVAQHRARRRNIIKLIKDSPEYKAQQQTYKLKHRYGITREIYDTMLKNQNGCCGLCGLSFNGENPCVDHDHKTNQVRMLLHNKCNALLGLVDDNPDILNLGVLYLAKFNKNQIK